MVAQNIEDRLDDIFVILKDFLDGRTQECSFTTDSLKPLKIFIDSRNLAKEILGNRTAFKKHFRALRYGYVGDRRGLNGIRDIHENDGRLYKLAANLLCTQRGSNVTMCYDLNPETVRPIKVVAHDPSSRRLYGIIDTLQSKVVLVGIGRYK